MLEIYKENLYDLLNNSGVQTHLKIKEHPKKGGFTPSSTTEELNSTARMP